MSYSNIALGIAVILGVAYLGLAIAAFRRMEVEHRSKEIQRLLAFTFWWPFYDVYKPSATGLRITGVVVLVASVVAYVAWGKLA
jgi:hypothetical protein